MKSKQDVNCPKISAQISTLTLASVLSLTVCASAFATQVKYSPAEPVKVDMTVLNDIENATIEQTDKVKLPVLTPELSSVESQVAETPPTETSVTVQPEEVDIPAISEVEDVNIPDIEQVNNVPIPQHTDYQNQFIPVIAQAKVFANLTDELPAVMNYFTEVSEEQVIDFYQQAYGESTSHERKRGRLTLTYQQDEQSMRVVISTQGDKRQVDVLVESAEQE